MKPQGNEQKKEGKMQYDPKLKEAIAEIDAILTKHDIAAQITLCSQTHTEFAHRFPTWSPLFISDEHKMRFRSKLADYPSQEAKDEAAGFGVHILASFREMAALHFGTMDKMLEMLSKHMEIEFDPIKIYPDRKN